MSAFWNLKVEDLPEKGIDALTEHCLETYLPFDGGLWQNFQTRNYKTNPNKRTKFYVVEYLPKFEYYQSPKIRNEKTITDDFRNTYKWATERGFEFRYGVIAGGDLYYNILPVETQSIFKVGLTNVKTKMRGGKRYKNIIIEKDITDLEIEPKDYETYIYAMLFYKYWKDKTFFKSFYLIDDGKHQELQFDGKTESFLFENVEDKLEIVREAMDRLENSPVDEIMQEVYKFMRLDFFWNRINVYKSFYTCSWFANLETFKSGGAFESSYSNSISLKCPFLIDIGFKDKWLRYKDDCIKDLFDKTAEEMILPNSKHWS